MCPCTVSQLKDQVENELKSNILDFWCKHAADNENGGFFGYISTDIHNRCRRQVFRTECTYLWTFSAAYRFYQEQKYSRHGIPCSNTSVITTNRSTWEYTGRLITKAGQRIRKTRKVRRCLHHLCPIGIPPRCRGQFCVGTGGQPV